VEVDAAHGLSGVSCPTAALCVVSDSSGRIVVMQPEEQTANPPSPGFDQRAHRDRLWHC
jgi:hypothetical protein